MKLKMRNLRAIERFLRQKELPGVSFFLLLIISFLILPALLSPILDRYIFNTLAVREILETQLMIAQGGSIVSFCSAVFAIFCVLKRPNNKFLFLGKLLVVGMFFVYISNLIHFFVQTSNNESRYDTILVLSFFRLLAFTYLITMTLLIIRMGSVSKHVWKVFDLLMLSIVLLAFCVGFFQKFYGVSDSIDYLILFTGAIAIALKLAKATCGFYASEK